MGATVNGEVRSRERERNPRAYVFAYKCTSKNILWGGILAVIFGPIDIILSVTRGACEVIQHMNVNFISSIPFHFTPTLFIKIQVSAVTRDDLIPVQYLGTTGILMDRGSFSVPCDLNAELATCQFYSENQVSVTDVGSGNFKFDAIPPAPAPRVAFDPTAQGCHDYCNLFYGTGANGSSADLIGVSPTYGLFVDLVGFSYDDGVRTSPAPNVPEICTCYRKRQSPAIGSSPDNFDPTGKVKYLNPMSGLGNGDTYCIACHSDQPSSMPSSQPSGQPSGQPSNQPSGQPSSVPSGQPSSQPSIQPSGQPSSVPSEAPSGKTFYLNHIIDPIVHMNYIYTL